MAHWIQRARDTCVNVGGFLNSIQQQQQQQPTSLSSVVPQMFKVNASLLVDASAVQSLEPYSTQLRLPYNAQREIVSANILRLLNEFVLNSFILGIHVYFITRVFFFFRSAIESVTI